MICLGFLFLIQCTLSCTPPLDSHVSLALVVDSDTGHMYDLDILKTFRNSCVDVVPALNTSDDDSGSANASGHIMNKSEFTCFIYYLNSKDSSKLLHIRLGHPFTNLLLNFLLL